MYVTFPFIIKNIIKEVHMSIYPDGTTKFLMRKWELAAVDVSIPDNLVDPVHAGEWDNYLACLSPVQLLRKLGQALDQFHYILDRTPDLLALPEKEQVVLYSKWCAAEAIAAGKSLFSFSPKGGTDQFTSDIDMQLFFVIDFLKGVHSPDVKLWEARRERHNQIDHGVFLAFLNSFSAPGAPGQKSVSTGPSVTP